MGRRCKVTLHSLVRQLGMVLLTDILQQRGREELRILRNRSMAERISLLLLKVAAIC